MLTEIDQASERGAVGPQASVWRWLFGFGLCLVPLNLLASAGGCCKAALPPHRGHPRAKPGPRRIRKRSLALQEIWPP